MEKIEIEATKVIGLLITLKEENLAEFRMMGANALKQENVTFEEVRLNLDGKSYSFTFDDFIRRLTEEYK